MELHLDLAHSLPHGPNHLSGLTIQDGDFLGNRVNDVPIRHCDLLQRVLPIHQVTAQGDVALVVGPILTDDGSLAVLEEQPDAIDTSLGAAVNQLHTDTGELCHHELDHRVAVSLDGDHPAVSITMNSLGVVGLGVGTELIAIRGQHRSNDIGAGLKSGINQASLVAGVDANDAAIGSSDPILGSGNRLVGLKHSGLDLHAIGLAMGKVDIGGLIALDGHSLLLHLTELVAIRGLILNDHVIASGQAGDGSHTVHPSGELGHKLAGHCGHGATHTGKTIVLVVGSVDVQGAAGDGAEGLGDLYPIHDLHGAVSAIVGVALLDEDLLDDIEAGLKGKSLDSAGGVGGVRTNQVPILHIDLKDSASQRQVGGVIHTLDGDTRERSIHKGHMGSGASLDMDQLILSVQIVVGGGLDFTDGIHAGHETAGQSQTVCTCHILANNHIVAVADKLEPSACQCVLSQLIHLLDDDTGSAVLKQDQLIHASLHELTLLRVHNGVAIGREGLGDDVLVTGDEVADQNGSGSVRCPSEDNVVVGTVGHDELAVRQPLAVSLVDQLDEQAAVLGVSELHPVLDAITDSDGLGCSHSHITSCGVNLGDDVMPSVDAGDNSLTGAVGHILANEHTVSSLYLEGTASHGLVFGVGLVDDQSSQLIIPDNNAVGLASLDGNGVLGLIQSIAIRGNDFDHIIIAGGQRLGTDSTVLPCGVAANHIAVLVPDLEYSPHQRSVGLGIQLGDEQGSLRNILETEHLGSRVLSVDFDPLRGGIERIALGSLDFINMIHAGLQTLCGSSTRGIGHIPANHIAVVVLDFKFGTLQRLLGGRIDLVDDDVDLLMVFVGDLKHIRAIHVKDDGLHRILRQVVAIGSLGLLQLIGAKG